MLLPRSSILSVSYSVLVFCRSNEWVVKSVDSKHLLRSTRNHFTAKYVMWTLVFKRTHYYKRKKHLLAIEVKARRLPRWACVRVDRFLAARIRASIYVVWAKPRLSPENAAVRLAFLVYKGPEMKLGSYCGGRKMQFSGPTLRSLAHCTSSERNFAVHFRRQRPVYGT